MHDGAWGFASGIDRTPEAAARLAEQAVATAKLSRVLSSRPGASWPPSRCTPTRSWVSAYEINPFDIAPADRAGRLLELSRAAAGAPTASTTSTPA